MTPDGTTKTTARARRNGRPRIDPTAAVGADDVGLDQLITKVGQRRLLPGPEAGRLLAKAAVQPLSTARRGARLAGGLAGALVGRSTLTPERGDRRFSDPAWSENWVFRRILQGYLACRRGGARLVDDAELDWENHQRMPASSSTI